MSVAVLNLSFGSVTENCGFISTFLFSKPSEVDPKTVPTRGQPHPFVLTAVSSLKARDLITGDFMWLTSLLSLKVAALTVERLPFIIESAKRDQAIIL